MQLETQSSPKVVPSGEGETQSSGRSWAGRQRCLFSSSRGVLLLQRCFPPPAFCASMPPFYIINVGLSQWDGTIACYGQGLVTLVIHALHVPCSPSFESSGMCKSICWWSLVSVSVTLSEFIIDKEVEQTLWPSSSTYWGSSKGSLTFIGRSLCTPLSPEWNRFITRVVFHSEGSVAFGCYNGLMFSCASLKQHQAMRPPRLCFSQVQDKQEALFMLFSTSIINPSLS